MREQGQCKTPVDAYMQKYDLNQWSVMCAELVPRRSNETPPQWEKRLVRREAWWIKRIHTFAPRGHNVKDVQNLTANYRRNQNRNWSTSKHRPPRQQMDEAPIWQTKHTNGSRTEAWHQMQDRSQLKRRAHADSRSLPQKRRDNNNRRRVLRQRLHKHQLEVDDRDSVSSLLKRVRRQTQGETQEIQPQTLPFQPPTPVALPQMPTALAQMPLMPPRVGPLPPPIQPKRLQRPPVMPPQMYDIWQGIDESWYDDVPPNMYERAPISTPIMAYWAQHAFMFDMDCAATWRLLTAIVMRLKQRRFDNSMMDQWDTGTIHRLLAAMLWGRKIHTETESDQLYWNQIKWMGKANMQRTIDELNHQLTSRAALRLLNRKEAEIWVTNFHSAIMDAMCIEEVSNTPEVSQAFPDAIKQTFGLPVVCWKYSTPLGIIISNEKSTVMKANSVCNKQCRCWEMPSKYHDQSGHVVTTDLSIVEYEPLRRDMKSGTTFRRDYNWMFYEAEENGTEKPEELLALDASIDRYIERCAKLNEVPTYLFDEWRAELTSKLQIRYNEVVGQMQVEATRCDQEKEEYDAHLKQLKNEYAIITGDKARNTYCIVCKPHLCKQIMKETHETKTYVECTQSETQITDANYEFLTTEGLVTVTAKVAEQMTPAQRPPKHTWFNENVPTFGVSLKMHKENSLRFMAKSHHTSLSQLSTWMSRVFAIMVPVSETIWRDLFLTLGIVTHGSWVISNSKQMRQRMARMQDAKLKPGIGGQQTYDFSTMYTSMKLDEVEKKMEEYVDLVFEYQKQHDGKSTDRHQEKVILVKHKGAGGWRVKSDDQHDTKSKKYITADRIKKWIKYLLGELYVKVGNQIMRQDIGLPMGTSCSPFLANLVLYMYELEFFTEEISQLRPWHADLKHHKKHKTFCLVRKLSYCTRYIDDLWNPLVDAKEFQQLVKKIYPPWLQLGLEHEGEIVNYLDMSIWCTAEAKWHSKLYDKKVGLAAKGLKLNRFPHPQSKLSTRCKYGVITSQLHRYNVACTRTCDFKEPALDLYTTYIDKGYKVQQIDSYFERFIRSHMQQRLPPDGVKRMYQQTGLVPSFGSFTRMSAN